MIGLRSLLTGVARARTLLTREQGLVRIQRRSSHDDGPPQPFDNMPFRVTSRYLTTVIFALLFGSGLWAPYLIVWYAMAKRTL